MNRPLHGVIVYDDISIAKLAKEKWDFMVNALRHDFQFELRLWKFDALRFPELSDMAVKDAAQAEMIIVATKGVSEFPSEVKGWMEQWLDQKAARTDVAGMLVFLCDPPPATIGVFAVSQFAYLQRTARKVSMDFIGSATTSKSQQSAFQLHLAAGTRPWSEDDSRSTGNGTKKHQTIL